MENIGLLNNWTKRETLKLIEEYKKYTHLYNTNHPDHLNLTKRRQTLSLIVKSLKCLKPTVTENLVKTKLKTLRHQMASEKKKMAYAKKNGTANHRPSLWCYDELSFLLNVVNEQTSSNKRFKKSQIFDESQFEEESDESEEFIRPTKKRRESEIESFQQTINKSMEIMEKISTTTSKVISKEEAFCQYLSTELAALKLEESFDEFKMSAMILLQNVKAKEKKIFQGSNKLVWKSNAAAEAAVSTLKFNHHTGSASSSAYSGSAGCSRKRSSSAESILNETIRSSSNDCDEDAYDDKSTVILCQDIKVEPDLDC